MTWLSRLIWRWQMKAATRDKYANWTNEGGIRR